LKNSWLKADLALFVITTHNGFAIAVGEDARRHILLGRQNSRNNGLMREFFHIPYTSISHIDEVKPSQ
jgi:hypothetical protein